MEGHGGTGEAGGGEGDGWVCDGWDCGKRRCGNGWREEREVGENCQQRDVYVFDFEYFFPAADTGEYDCLYIFVYYLLLYGFKTSWYNITIISSIVMRS